MRITPPERFEPFLRRRRSIGIALGVIGCAVVAATFAWSKVDEIDIHSARVRRSVFLGPVLLTQRPIPSPFAEKYGREFQPGQAERWERGNSWSGWERFSPHYRYHGVPERLRDFCRFSPSEPATRATALQIVAALERDDPNEVERLADEWLWQLESRLADR